MKTQASRRRILASVAVIVLAACQLAGCGDADTSEHGVDSEIGERGSAIRGGTVDKTTDSVVGIVSERGGNSVSLCTGTLISRNLVLTARHCVAAMKGLDSNDNVICGQSRFGSTYDADSVKYVTPAHDLRTRDGERIRSSVSPARRVDRIDVPRSSDEFCNSDIALLTLGRPIPASTTKPIPPRIAKPATEGETFTAIGYGLDGSKDHSSGLRRRADGETVDKVCGTSNCGNSPREFHAVAATCQGDSGGPALDAKGRTFGVTSRGTDSCRRAVYTSVYDWRLLVRTAQFRASAREGYATPAWANLKSDRDGDGIHDGFDNCPDAANTDQSDIDDDGRGDACDTDTDDDGAADGTDNCPSEPNPAQENLDGDEKGDACDEDVDGDSVPDERDNCPKTPNAEQKDYDGDGTGDPCDDDVDGDGIPNDEDMCDARKHNDGPDLDGDGIADVCDSDDDGDGQLDEFDNCPRTDDVSQKDTDMDGKGDPCDEDLDGDGHKNKADNCPAVANPDQIDEDGDGTGDACQDDDGDGVPRSEDSCPTIPNEHQLEGSCEGGDAGIGGDASFASTRAVAEGGGCSQTGGESPSGGWLGLVLAAALGATAGRRRR